MNVLNFISSEGFSAKLNALIKILLILILTYIFVFFVTNGSDSTTTVTLESDSIYMTEGRTISYRSHPLPTVKRNNNIYCAEPAPDYGVSSNEMQSFGLGLEKISADTEVKDIKKIKKIYDRAHNIQLLRDVLYRSCEAYANGIINHEEYSRMFEQTVLTSTILMGANMMEDITQVNEKFAIKLYDHLTTTISKTLEYEDKENLSSKPNEVLYKKLEGLAVGKPTEE